MKVNKTYLKENTLVKFDLKNGISGTGRIKGIAVGETAIIGKGYIVEIIDSIGMDKKEYPYSAITIFELFIEVIENLN